MVVAPLLRCCEQGLPLWAALALLAPALLGSEAAAPAAPRPYMCLVQEKALRGRSPVASRHHQEAASLAEVGAASDRQHRRQQPATWFGGFSQAESTYDPDGIPHADAGFAPAAPVLPDPTALPSKWFQESASGGPLGAWQTYFPAITDYRPKGKANPPWRETHTQGGFRQVYEADERVGTIFSKTASKGADWFEASVGTYDAFGRARAPGKRSERQQVLAALSDWSLRSWNTTLQCADPGCMANSTLQLFDGTLEQHRECKLSVAVHATDFDDEYSREYVELLAVNGRTVSSKCDPMVKGCTPEAGQQLYPCLRDYSIDHLVAEDGVMNISGKLSPLVDECPVDGNLLSGIAVVTCLVRPLSSAALALPRQTAHEAEAAANGTVLLRCQEPGCVAEADVILNEDVFLNKTCKLTLRISQTDFDGDHDSTEELEWVKVGNRTAKEHVKPGRNPCKEEMLGAGNSTEDDPFTVLDGEDVSSELKDGKLVVTAKLSDMVDECGRGEGFLLDGQVKVVCS